MMSNFFNNPYYQTNPNLNVPSTDITIPKVTNNSLELRQIQGFEMVDSKLSKLYALCKAQQEQVQNDIPQHTEPQKQIEHIEDINLETIMKDVVKE